MLGIAESIDDGNRGKPSQILEILVFENAGHDRIHPAGEISREILNGFPLTKPALRGSKHDRPSAQVPDGDFECHSRWERRFFENHRNRFALKLLGKHVPPPNIARKGWH